jgi:hypothetical protein
MNKCAILYDQIFWNQAIVGYDDGTFAIVTPKEINDPQWLSENIDVSEFCLDTDSPRVPSFCVPSKTPSYNVFMAEIRILLTESVPILGSNKGAILETL